MDIIEECRFSCSEGIEWTQELYVRVSSLVEEDDDMFNLIDDIQGTFLWINERLEDID